MHKASNQPTVAMNCDLDSRADEVRDACVKQFAAQLEAMNERYGLSEVMQALESESTSSKAFCGRVLILHCSRLLAGCILCSRSQHSQRHAFIKI